MKRILSVILLLAMLTGCSVGDKQLDRAIGLRNKLLSAGGCTFDAKVTADYGDRVYTFHMRCRSDNDGEVSFEVLSPESIAGITGNISAEGGKLTFDDQALLFELLAEGQITPVSAPWLLIRTLRSGYIKACGEHNDGMYLQIDDSYADDALHLDIWTDNQDLPVRAEILWQGKRVVSMDVESFTFV